MCQHARGQLGSVCTVVPRHVQAGHGFKTAFASRYAHLVTGKADRHSQQTQRRRSVLRSKQAEKARACCTNHAACWGHRRDRQCPLQSARRAAVLRCIKRPFERCGAEARASHLYCDNDTSVNSWSYTAVALKSGAGRPTSLPSPHDLQDVCRRRCCCGCAHCNFVKLFELRTAGAAATL